MVNVSHVKVNMDYTQVAKILIALEKDMIPKNKKIGVVVSGGLDSSVLWHLIYGECLRRNQECIPFTVPKQDGALTYATRMLEYSCEYYGTKRLHPWVINSDGVDWKRDNFQGTEVQQQLPLRISRPAPVRGIQRRQLEIVLQPRSMKSVTQKPRKQYSV